MSDIALRFDGIVLLAAMVVSASIYLLVAVIALRAATERAGAVITSAEKPGADVVQRPRRNLASCAKITP
jgi:hypothetical protein